MEAHIATIYRYQNGPSFPSANRHSIDVIRTSVIEYRNKILNGENSMIPKREPDLSEAIKFLIGSVNEPKSGDKLDRDRANAAAIHTLCVAYGLQKNINSSIASAQSSQSQSSDSQQAQQLTQRAQESQQRGDAWKAQLRPELKEKLDQFEKVQDEQTRNALIARDSQYRAKDAQKEADESRKGKRRRHEPENEASHCIQPDFGGLYGGMKNTCNFKVWYTYCGYRPTENSWLSGMNCEKQSFGSDSVSPGRTSAAHTKGVQQLYWFACKSPARAVDGEFVEGKGISARCDSADGRANQTRVGSSVKKQQRNPQTISQGPVSVTLIPTNNTSSKCYDIAYENRSDKHVDIFLKFSLTNNKTGEKGTSVWLGDNTNFDGLFGSANTNRLNPKSSMETTKTVMYNHWLMAKNFIFNNQPSDLYGFNNTVENCDDITAEIPSGGLKWNENAYQRHFDACRSPIKRNRPVGC